MKWHTLGACIAFLLCVGNAPAKTVTVETIEVSPAQGEDNPAASPETIPLGDLPGTLDGAEETIGDVPDVLQDRPQILYNKSYLPEPVARMHSQMMEAALSGDINRMRIILESNEVMPTLSFGEIEDPIDFLKESSGDGEGYEILAILADILDAGFVHVDAGTPQEMYVWPYFSRYPIQDLTPEQKVELFRIVTSGDFAEMEQYGAWNFYRVGIGPDGTLHYFVAGD
jgi:hypothetical protein